MSPFKRDPCCDSHRQISKSGADEMVFLHLQSEHVLKNSFLFLPLLIFFPLVAFTLPCINSL